MAWGAAAAMLIGTIYSANKQDKAARRQEDALRRSQSESRAEAARGKQEIKEAYGQAMDTIDTMTPEIIRQFQNGQLTTQRYLTNFTDTANLMLDIGADEYKASLLGDASEITRRGTSGRAIPALVDSGGLSADKDSLNYGLGGAESTIEQARFDAARDITQGRDTARSDLIESARRGEQALTSDLSRARDEVGLGKWRASQGLTKASNEAQRQLGKLQTGTDRLLRKGQATQLDLLRGGQQDIESALRGGYQDAITAEQSGAMNARNDLRSALSSAKGISADTGELSPYSAAGRQATALELALSGAAGPEAQAEAYANFEESAGQKFLRERQEQSLLRNAAATGGLQGGNVLTALQEQAQGIAAQDLQRQVGNLQSLSGRGLQAAGQMSSLGTQANLARGQLSANIQSKMADLSRSTGLSQSQLQRALGDKLAGVAGQFMGAESQLRQNTLNQQLQNMQDTSRGQADIGLQTAQGIAGIETGAADRLYQSLQQQGLTRNQIEQVLGGDLAGLGTDAARQLAGNQMQAGGAIGSMRMGVGQQIAGNIGQTRQQQSANMGALGANLANLNDRTSTNIANLLQNQMTNRSQLEAALGTNLGNISVGQGSNTLNFANQLAQAAGLRDIAQANKVTGITNAIGDFASSVDWGSMGDGSTQQQEGNS